MEDVLLKNLWKQQDAKLEKYVQLNLRLFESVQKQKAESALKGLAKFKTWAVVSGIVWVLFLALLVYGNQLQNLFFSISAGMIAVITLVAIAIYMNHISVIKAIDYSQPIARVQQKLATLQASTFNNRFIILQAPFYTTWFWSTEMIEASVTRFCLIAVPITLLFTLLTIWLYKNLTPGNMHKKWVSYLLKNDPEHKPVMQAQKFLHELEEFSKPS